MGLQELITHCMSVKILCTNERAQIRHDTNFTISLKTRPLVPHVRFWSKYFMDLFRPTVPVTRHPLTMELFSSRLHNHAP